MGFEITKSLLVFAVAVLGRNLAKRMVSDEIVKYIKNDKHISEAVVEQIDELGCASLDEVIFYSDASQFSPDTIKTVCWYGLAWRKVDSILTGIIFLSGAWALNNIRRWCINALQASSWAT